MGQFLGLLLIELENEKKIYRRKKKRHTYQRKISYQIIISLSLHQVRLCALIIITLNMYIFSFSMNVLLCFKIEAYFMLVINFSITHLHYTFRGRNNCRLSTKADQKLVLSSKKVTLFTIKKPTRKCHRI